MTTTLLAPPPMETIARMKRCMACNREAVSAVGAVLVQLPFQRGSIASVCRSPECLNDVLDAACDEFREDRGLTGTVLVQATLAPLDGWFDFFKELLERIHVDPATMTW